MLDLHVEIVGTVVRVERTPTIVGDIVSTANRSHKLRMDHTEWTWFNDDQTCAIVQLCNLLALQLVAIGRCQHAVTVVRYIVTATHLLLTSILLHAHGTGQTLLALTLMLHCDLLVIASRVFKCTLVAVRLAIRAAYWVEHHWAEVVTCWPRWRWWCWLNDDTCTHVGLHRLTQRAPATSRLDKITSTIVSYAIRTAYFLRG